MSFERLRQTTVRIQRLAAPTLADFAHRYGVTVSELHAANRTAHRAWTDEAAFVRDVEAGETFVLPIPPSERALLWEHTPVRRGQTLQAMCQGLNPARATQHLTPIQPSELWGYSVNAPFREAVLHLSAREARANIDSHPENAAWNDSHPQFVYVPGDRGQPQAPIRAQPNGTVTTEVVPEWLVTARRHLEMLETRLDALARANDAVQNAEGRYLQETAYITLLEHYIALLDRNRGLGRYAEELRRIATLKNEARQHMVLDRLREDQPPLLRNQEAAARWVEMIVHRNQTLRSALAQARAASLPPTQGASQPAQGSSQPAQGSAAAQGAQIWDWSMRLFERTIRELNRVHHPLDVLDRIDQALPQGLATLAQSPDSAFLWAIGTLAGGTPMFVGNAPGPANFYVAVLQYSTFRTLADVAHLHQRFPNFVSQLVQEIGHVFGASAQARQSALTRIQTGQRAQIEEAARDLTGGVQTGRLPSLVLLLCAGGALFATYRSWQHGDTSTVEAILSAGGTVSGGVSSFAQVIIASCQQGSQTAATWQAIGERAGRVAAVIGVVASAYSLIQHIRTTDRAQLNYWKITGYGLNIIGGVLTLGAYLRIVPGGQMIGGFLTLGGFIALMIADPESARQYFEAPVNTFVRHLLEKIEQGHYYRLALQRGAPTLLTAMSNVRYALETYSLGLNQYFVVRSDAQRRQLLAALQEMGIPENRATPMLAE